MARLMITPVTSHDASRHKSLGANLAVIFDPPHEIEDAIQDKPIKFKIYWNSQVM